MSTQQVQTVEHNQVATTNQEQTSGLLTLIERVAMSPDADLNKMSQLLDMQERVLDRNAKQAFAEAMAEMQPHIPVVVERTKSHNGKYASFEDIIDQTRPVLQKHGFSVTFRVQQDEHSVKVTCVLSHREGHSEQTDIALPADTSGSKNAVQAVGSTVSYGRRYTYCALLNIATRGEDDDGHRAAQSVDLFRHNMVVQQHFDLICEVKASLAEDDIDTARGALNDLSDEEKHAIWVAPTKGGIFTTEERRKLKEGK